MSDKKDKVITHIFSIFEKHGSADYIGEQVTQIEHTVQSAMLAEDNKQDDEVIIACLFHDLGHLLTDNAELMSNLGVKNHEKVGADYLRKLGFSEKVCLLIENHVNAKRYLVYKNSDYYQKLSDASKKTLEFQGGMMEKEEAEKFEKDPNFALYLKMREFDEKAKVPEMKIKDLKDYYQKIFKLIQ